jgi:cell wall-associated NlpC family hydrolase
VPAPRTPARPALSAGEIQSLRAALAQRQATGRPLTPEQAALLQVAADSSAARPRTAARTPARRTPAVRRPAARRPATGRVQARTSTGRTEVGRTEVGRRKTDRNRPERTGSRWSTRIGMVVTSAVLVPALITVALTGPRDPGGSSPDATALALTAQTSLLEQAGRYRQLEQETAEARADLRAAREAEAAARVRLSAQQRIVGTTAAEIYTATAEERYPMLGLDASDTSPTGDVLYRQALAERADRALQGTVIRAERADAAVTEAAGRVAAAESAVDAAAVRAAAVLADARATIDDLSTEVSLQLAALGTVPAPATQQGRNDQAVARWQAYLGRFARAGIEPPAAADLADLDDLPTGFSPALDAARRAIPGVAWAVDGSEPVTVVPAETVAAVSTALSQLGRPFAPATAGPDTYDCGGFTSATWLLAGYALPATPQAQWASGAAVPLTDLQYGDLVFSPGGQDVGIYVGDGDVVGASADTYRVSVRSVAAGSTAVRVPLPPPAEPNPALPLSGPTGACGAAVPEPGAATPQWGGWANGQIPSGALCELGVHRHALRCDAAAAYRKMGAAYQSAFGRPLCITDSYRSLGAQVTARTAKPTLAAVPGTSNHGWALAVDLCDGINVFGTSEWTWMTQHAGRFGFVQPQWAGPGGDKPEPWHWEFGYIS